MALSIFSRLFGTRAWTLERLVAPWGDRPSLYRFLRSARGGEVQLPDEAPQGSNGGIRWAAGAYDGVFGFHGGQQQNRDVAAEVHRALALVSAAPSSANARALYALLTAHRALEFVDPFLEMVRSDRDLPAERVHAIASWLATEAADREPVKVGLSLLGIASSQGDEGVLIALGRHDEFTLFAAVALGSALAAPEPALWDLARSVHGWGRVQIVARLGSSSDPVIKAWLLREGFRNSVMYEYLAYTCAVAGNLHDELARPELEAAVFDAAGELLTTLIDGRGGPAEGIDEYADGATATERYLGHAARRATRPPHLLALKRIEQFLRGDGPWDKLASTGWTVALRERLATEAAAITARPQWRDRPREDRHRRRQRDGHGPCLHAPPARRLRRAFTMARGSSCGELLTPSLQKLLLVFNHEFHAAHRLTEGLAAVACSCATAAALPPAHASR